MNNNKFIQFLFVAFVLAFISCHNPEQKKSNKTEDSKDTSSVDKEIAEVNSKIHASPNNPDLYHERAKLRLLQKDINASFADMNRAMMMDSSKASYYITIADIYFAMNKSGKSKTSLEKCLKLDPKNVEANLKLAELYIFVQDYKKSIGYVDDALKIDIHNPKAYFMKGMDFKNLSDTSKAISSFRTAIEQNPRYYEAFMQLGLIFSKQNNGLAIQYFNSAIGLKPKSIEAYYGRAFFLQENNDLDKAIADYNTILEIDPKYKYAHYNLGYIDYVYLKKNDSAIKHFADAIASDNNYSEAYYMRGLSYEALGNKHSASLDYQKAISIDPDYELAKAGLERVGK